MSDWTCLTLDVDWAPDPVVADVTALIESADVKATLFATHESAHLSGLDPARFEVGLHPDFRFSTDDYSRPLRELKRLYPSAAGGRSHTLFVSSAILEQYRAHGLLYESNVFLPHHAHLHPVERFRGFLSLPYNWSDDKHLELERGFDADSVELERRPGLNVLAFHPIHVFMNTHSHVHYMGFKQHTRDPDRLAEVGKGDEPGMRDLFVALLGRLAERRTSTCSDACNEWTAAQLA